MNQIALRSPAGFWKRYVAYFIDVVLVYIVLELLTRLLFPDQGFSDQGAADQIQALMSAVQNHQALSDDQTALLKRTAESLSSMLMFTSIAYVVIAGAYFVVCESSAWQATLGKRLLGIKVVDANGARISAGRALGRFVAASLSWLTLNVGHAMAAIKPEHRALHDYVADTRVENVDPDHPQMPLWGWLIVGAHALAFMLCVVGASMAMALALRAADQF
ncbi:MAG TPA: RDD family protein [Xanthomonadaceae bacterium]|jgi:uncharacterized RDD family membrane protein YckC|nr:RDD family protein [Xanthomonadaceae bacterium]